MRNMRTGLIAAVGVLLLGMGLTACGGDSDDGGTFGVGSDAPGFALPDSAGGTVALADFGDEPVLLYFHMADG